LRQASLEAGAAFPSESRLRDDGSLIVRIGLIDARYNRISDAAKQSGAARVENGQLVLEPGSVETGRAFIAAPVRDYTYRGANVSFVQYQPHANARDRKMNPALYFVRLFMNLLLAGTLTFFVIHTILWLIRARYDQIKKRSANGGKHA